MAEVAGTAVQQVAQRLGGGTGEGGMNAMRAGGAGAQAGAPLHVEGVNGVAHGLLAAVQHTGNLRHLAVVGGGEQDLAAAHDKGIGRPQACFHVLTLRVGERADVNQRLHAIHDTA